MISDKSQTESVYSVLSEAVVDLKKSQIKEVRFCAKPSEKARIISPAIVYVLDGKKKKIQSYDWETIKKFFGDSKFCEYCKTYDPAKFQKERLAVLESYMKKNEIDTEESVKASKYSSLAIASMHRWLLMLVAEANKEK